MIPSAPYAPSRDRSDLEHPAQIEASLLPDDPLLTPPPPIRHATTQRDAAQREPALRNAVQRDPVQRDSVQRDPAHREPAQRAAVPQAPAQHGANTRSHRLLALLAEARAQRAPAPAPALRRADQTAAEARQQSAIPRDLDFQIDGIRAFISRLECEIATRHGQRAERCLTLNAQRRHVEDLEAELADLRPGLAGAKWIDLVERYNAAKTHLGHLSEIDKRQTAIDISDDPHMEAELCKWRDRLARILPRNVTAA